MTTFNSLANQKALDLVVKNLNTNGFAVVVANNIEEAKKKVFQLIPEKSEVMTMSSETLRLSGITSEINDSGKFNSVKNKLNKLDRQTDGVKMQKLGSAPEYTIGSVHAVTEDGHLIIASNTGSQLPAYVYGSAHVVFVVGTQKIVKDDTEGIKRIYEYIVPKESKRLAEAYGNPDLKTNVSKLLIINKEIMPERITIILVKEELGF